MVGAKVQATDLGEHDPRRREERSSHQILIPAPEGGGPRAATSRAKTSTNDHAAAAARARRAMIGRGIRIGGVIRCLRLDLRHWGGHQRLGAHDVGRSRRWRAARSGGCDETSLAERGARSSTKWLHRSPTPEQFVADSPLEGAVTSELVSGIRRNASFWHFIPAYARARAATRTSPRQADLPPANSSPR